MIHVHVLYTRLLEPDQISQSVVAKRGRTNLAKFIPHEKKSFKPQCARTPIDPGLNPCGYAVGDVGDISILQHPQALCP